MEFYLVANCDHIPEAIEKLLDDKVDRKVEEEKWNNRKRIGFKN